jgi:hypothetical protein
VEKEILFDNSALSRLVEESDGDRAALVAGLRTLGRLRLTALNVVETARTTDAELRFRKLRFYQSVSKTVAPIDEPLELLAMICRAHHDGRGSIRTGDQYAYALLTRPELATEEFRHALNDWASDHEERFDGRHRRMRERFDETFATMPEQRFAMEKEFIEFTLENAEHTLRTLVTTIYEDATEAKLDTSDVSLFLEHAMPMKIFIVAQSHALWVRSLRKEGPGKKKAGSIDTDSAVYLNFCDRFITNDHAQADTLKVANERSPSGTVVELYSDLRARLML